MRKPTGFLLGLAVIAGGAVRANSAAFAEAPPAAPSSYQRSIEQPTPDGGTMGAPDAATIEGEAMRAGEATTAPPDAPPGRIEEIVVSARKRAELLEDTPVAVSALSADALRDHGVQRLDQIAEMVPNLQFGGSVMGSAATVRIRGIGSGNFDLQFDPGVGIYLDGVFLPRAFGALLDVVDIEQVEVLRGPQGTLFGKNTVGGAINVTTVKPEPEIGGFAMLRPGNLGSVETQVMVNVPVVEEKLLSRVAFSSADRAGYVHDDYRGEWWDDQNDLAFLGTLRLLLTEEATFDLTGTWSRAHSRGLGGQCKVANPNASLVGVYPSQAYFDLCRETTPFEMSSNTMGLTDVEGYGTWGVLTWDLGHAVGFDDVSLKAQGSWTEQIPRFRFDVDNTEMLVVSQSTAGGGVNDGAPGRQRQVAGELQLNAGALDGFIVFVSGLFWQSETGNESRTTVVGPNLNRFTTNQTQIDNWTFAPYLQATADLTDWLSLTAGYRYTWDDKKLTVNQFDPRTGRALLADAVGQELFTRGTPMTTLAATLPVNLLPDWSNHFMTYFTYAQGFKGGGFNALAGTRAAGLGDPFLPETLDSYEVGFKTILLDSRATINTALFYGKYDDIQKVSVRTSLAPDGSPITQRVTENAAKATTKGFEVETLVLPIDGLQVTGSVGVTDARYDDFPDAISDFDATVIDRSGQSFNDIPKLQTFVSVQYSFPLFERGPENLEGWLTPRFEWYYQSQVHYNGPELLQSVQPGYNLLNARLSYDFLSGRAQVALWGENLADQTYFNFSTPIASTFGTVINYTALPRTWGGEFSYRF